jgi:hypothetical protein
MKKPLLKGRCVAISISNTPDMAVRGLGKEHLEDAMSEIARHVIASGATIAYGGDLRPGGFTELLFEIVNRYRRNRDGDKILVENYLAWPVHMLLTRTELEKTIRELEGLASIVLLAPDGKRILLNERPADRMDIPDAEWAQSLTAMRRAMLSQTHARIVLGGQTAKYKGRMPGIAEEALLQLESRKPLYLLGGYGGCSAHLAQRLGLTKPNAYDTRAAWAGLEEFDGFSTSSLNNGLTPAENARLATTVHVDEASALILRGLVQSGRAGGKNKA